MVRQGTEAGISDFYNSWLKFLSEQMAPLASRTIAIGPLPEGQQIAGTISRQIFKLLGAKTLPSHLEAELVSLRAVLVDFDDIENQQERQARLIQARDTLGRLQPAAGSFPIQSHSTTLRSSFSSRSERAITSKPTAKSDLWTLPIRFAKGVGPSRARLLEKLGVSTIEEAFWFLPWRYEDWSVIVPIQHLRPETKSTVAGCVTSCQLRRTSKKGLVMIIVSIEDGTGTLDAVFFNQPFLEQFFARGRHVLLRGEVSVGKRGSVVYQMRSPQYEVIQRDGGDSDGLSKLVPVYHETKGLTSRQFRRILQGLYELYGQDIQEVLPDSLLNELQLPSLKTAVSTLHFPQETHNVLHLNEGTIPAHQRMAFEELLLLQLALTVRRHMVKTESGGIAFSLANVLSRRFQNLLPFELTSSQKRVIQEIEKDMAGLTSMNRLLQGDVGSGKTLVALHAMVLACGSGYQAALLVPTEVLSEQHFLTVEPYFSQLGLTVVWVKGAQSARERAKVLGQLASGQAQVAVGTHALLQPEVVFSNLGLVVVDEQHKFGVIQRAQLRKKSTHPPNVLVMTATPIPRTLAMTVYGDLDVSVIDQSPPGRKPVRTLLFCEDEREKAYGLLRKEVNAGRQVYIVYPLVERSEKIDLQAAVQAGERLQREEFPEFMVGLLHGRMKSKEKQAVMTAFKAGHIHILVATTVIEVGVDVSNATVILIEHPERFGLAQLHQLRGRVGRGAEQAYCLLLRSAKKLDAHESLSSGNPELPLTLSHNNRNEGEDVELLRNIRQESHRLRVFTQCADGFSLAKADLKIRGPGNILGEKQWGTIEFRVADLIRDHNLLVEARQMAKKLLAKDPQLNSRELEPLRAAMLRKWGETFELGSIG